MHEKFKVNDWKLKELPPLSLYIHIPWCAKKCPYCDFNSHKASKILPEDSYIDSLILDLELSLPLIWGRLVRTIFIGGGTPSLFSGDSINRLLTAIRARVNLSPFAEITIEANPGSTDNNHIKDYAKAGVNRISLGVQSFNDKHLSSLGRVHDSSKAVEAIEIAKNNFKNINLDIIYALPNQTIDELNQDIVKALSFNVNHLSCYNLTLEPNTAFYANPPLGLPDNDLCYMMQDSLIAMLANNGYRRYEISAYAKNNNFAEHNLNYWHFGDYLGIGAGAHSKLSFYDKILRQVREKHPKAYMDKVIKTNHIIEDKQILSKDLPFEFMLNALRLLETIPTKLFVERTGLGLTQILENLETAQKKGFLTIKDNSINTTKLGQDFLNDLLMIFL